MSVQTRSDEFAGLHRGILGNLQVLAQSVSGIGPSIGAAALIPWPLPKRVMVHG